MPLISRKNDPDLANKNFQVVSKEIGSVPSFEGTIIGEHDGQHQAFLVKRNSDGTLWHREFKDLKYEDGFTTKE